MIKTTKDLIKILPFEDKFKKDLLESFDSLSPGRKLNIQLMLWDTYYGLYDLKIEENISIALKEAEENREKLNKDFYKRVRDLTEAEMNQLTAEDIKALDIDMAREKLSEIIKDKPSS